MKVKNKKRARRLDLKVRSRPDRISKTSHVGGIEQIVIDKMNHYYGHRLNSRKYSRGHGFTYKEIAIGLNLSPSRTYRILARKYPMLVFEMERMIIFLKRLENPGVKDLDIELKLNIRIKD